MTERRSLARQGRLAAALLMLTVLFGGSVAADDQLPVVRAGSPRVDIQDGNRLLRGTWSVSPGTDLDVYYARRSKGERKVTFRTDVDSISFQVRPGQSYDFVVLLDGKHRCRSRISTMRETCRKDGDPNAPAEDAIPFTIGGDHKIHIAGRINDSEPLDLLLDMGADTLVLYPSARAKNVNVRIDGKAGNAGTGGTATRDSSNDNSVALGKLRWDHESVLLIEKQADRSDGIVGHNVFDDKVVEFDYDAMLVRISDAVPERAAVWTALPIEFQGTLPAVQARFEGGPEVFEEWLVLDTGSSTSVYLNQKTAVQQRLPGTMKTLGTSWMRGVGEGTARNEVVRLPKLSLGNLELRDVPLHVRANGPQADDGLSGHLGMDVLKRFNTVLDFQNDVAYFSPSEQNRTAYRLDYDDGSRWWLAAGVASLFLVVGLLWLRRRAIVQRGPPVMNAEEILISTFVTAAKRKHYIEILANPKRRHRATVTLAHFSDFDPTAVVHLGSELQTSSAIEVELRSRGAGESCHVISENRAIDGKNLPLKQALEKTFGHGLGTLLSCVPGELAYYEGEGPADRCILARRVI